MTLPASTRDAIAIGMLAIGLLVAVILVAWAPVAWAEDAATVRLSLKDHRFQPAEARAPAGKPITIVICNFDPTPAEFESKTLRVEKVVAGGGTITVQSRPLAAGRYRFFDDYHEDTTEGFLNVQ
jgi:Cupredoxin-like domain